MFPAPLAAYSATTPSTLPRPHSRPLRRIGAALSVAVTVLALMVASAVPARANVAALIPTPKADHPLLDPVPLQARNPRVPAVCALEVSTGRRDVTVYTERCLRREGFDYRLPRYCAQSMRVFGRPDRVYSERCLREAGFRVDGFRGHDRGYRDHGRGHGRDHDRGHGRPWYY